MNQAVIQRKIVSAAKTLGVDIADPMEFNLASGFLRPLAEVHGSADVLRNARPIWYLYEKALDELRLVTGHVPKK